LITAVAGEAGLLFLEGSFVFGRFGGRNTERDSRAHAVSVRDFFTPEKNLRDAQASLGSRGPIPVLWRWQHGL
jgi:hypothetical protein